MIKNVRIKNFKSIKDLNLAFGKLNFMCGENASGKTSVIHAILIASQKDKNDYTTDGSIIKLGVLDELKNRDSKMVSIKLTCDTGKKKLIFERNKDINSSRNEALTVDPNPSDYVPYEKKLFYLSSNRVGVADTYSKGNFLFGSNGEAVIDFLYKEQEETFSQSYMDYFNKKYQNTNVSQNAKFFEHVRFWMEKITGEKIGITSIPYTNQYVLTFNQNTRAINTGSGYSFLLPIIVVCLGAILVGNENPTVVLENPEIYLHPEAQKSLTEFFIFCKEFEQLIIETHSEHILKNAIDDSKSKAKIFVIQKENGETCKKEVNRSNFKISPPSYAEIIYQAFNLPTEELHILLYGKLQEKAGQSNIKKFDEYLETLSSPLKTWKYNGTQYKTLPTFIRNKIDHPDGKDSSIGQTYSYSQIEIKKSIDWLLSQL